jgi:hypothetical protein
VSELFAIQPNGTAGPVPNTYEGIKSGLGGAILTFLRAGPELGMYLDDNGMLENQPLNVAASMLVGRPLYGPVVICLGDPDREGDALPAAEKEISIASMLAHAWWHVVNEASQIGQDVRVYPNPDTIPPAQIISLSDDQFEAFLRDGTVPDE